MRIKPSNISSSNVSDNKVTLLIPLHLLNDFDLIVNEVKALGLEDMHILKAIDMITGKASADILREIQRKFPDIKVIDSGYMHKV